MHVEHTIEIDAPVEVVWQVTEAIEAWPNWTPTITSIRKETAGPIRIGSVARVKQPGQAESKWIVTEIVPERRFAWQMKTRMLQMTAVHDLEPTVDGTRCVLRIDASGVLATVLGPLMAGALRRALASENAGLKRHCEALAAPGPVV
jgi:carbon monoxide dehydrogenase subunit G